VAPRQVRDDVPTRLEDVILKTLEKDRDLRYQTAGDLRVDLKRIKREIEARPGQLPSNALAPDRGTAPVPVAAAPASSDAELVASLVKRHRRSVLVVAAAIVLAIVGGIYVATTRRMPPAVAPPPVASLQDLQIT